MWRRGWQLALLVTVLASACGGSSDLAKTDKDLARIAAAKADSAFSLVPPDASVVFGPAVTYGGDIVTHDMSYKAERTHVDVHEIEQTVAYENSRAALRRVAAFYVEQLPREGWVLTSLDCPPGSGRVVLRARKMIKGIPGALTVFAHDDGRASMNVDVPIVGAARNPPTRVGSTPTNACLDFISLERPWAVFEKLLRSGAGLSIATFEGRLCPDLEDRARRSALTDAERAFFANTTYGGLGGDKYDYEHGSAELIIGVRTAARGPARQWRVALTVDNTVWKLCTIAGPLDDT